MTTTLNRISVAIAAGIAAAAFIYSLGDIPYVVADGFVEPTIWGHPEGANLAEFVLNVQQFNGNLTVFVGTAIGVVTLVTTSVGGALLPRVPASMKIIGNILRHGAVLSLGWVRRVRRGASFTPTISGG